MAELYRQGYTLQQIGDAYSITRERVRQILRRCGVKSDAGGIHERARRNREAREARLGVKRDARCAATYGCGYDDLLFLNGGRLASAKGSPASMYGQQRKNAQTRGIGWEITFPEWIRIWNESGHAHQRGRGKRGYGMARKNDFGPYAPWNVYITTCAQNAADYQAELKRRGVECADGYKRLPERAAAMEAA